MNKPDDFDLRFSLPGPELKHMKNFEDPEEIIDKRNYVELYIESDALVVFRNANSIDLTTKEYKVTVRKRKGNL